MLGGPRRWRRNVGFCGKNKPVALVGLSVPDGLSGTNGSQERKLWKTRQGGHHHKGLQLHLALDATAGRRLVV